MRKWKDITNYSRDDKERIPRTYELEIKDVRLRVTRKLLGDPGIWYGVIISGTGELRDKPLGSRSIDHAKAELLNDFLEWLEDMADEVKKEL
jgi:hypothetical protein